MTANLEQRARDEALESLIAAYEAGATDTHNWWAAGNQEKEADFAEAARDYADSVLYAPAIEPAQDDETCTTCRGTGYDPIMERRCQCVPTAPELGG